jgi:hypothetical protein
MMTAENAQPTTKRIEHLSLKELDMIYSLARIGEWTNLEIGRRYGISETGVHKVVDNYSQLRQALLRNPLRHVSPQAPESGLTVKKPRNRRSDAIYATAKDRQETKTEPWCCHVGARQNLAAAS